MELIAKLSMMAVSGTAEPDISDGEDKRPNTTNIFRGTGTGNTEWKHIIYIVVRYSD